MKKLCPCGQEKEREKWETEIRCIGPPSQIAACPGPGSSLFPTSSYQNWSKQLRVLWTHCRGERGRSPSGRGNSAGTRQKDILRGKKKEELKISLDKYFKYFSWTKLQLFWTCTLHHTLSTQSIVLIPDTAFASWQTDSRWITLYRRKYFNRNIIIAKLTLKCKKITGLHFLASFNIWDG